MTDWLQGFLVKIGLGGYYRYTINSYTGDTKIVGPYKTRKRANPFDRFWSYNLDFTVKYHLFPPEGAELPAG